VSKRTQRRAEQRRVNREIREQTGAAIEAKPLQPEATETMLAKQAPTGRPETMLAKQAPTGRPETKSATSEAQIAANRENATHSTGPVSDAGKAAVSQNRTVHGLNYNPNTFRVLACEDQAQYDALLKALTEEQNPQDTTETLLVTAMAQHNWLLQRANRLQETCFDQETAQITDQKLFSLYLRYATTHERAFHKCLNDLLKLRNQKINQQNGFESEKRKSDRHRSFLKLEEISLRVQHVKAEMAEYMAARQIDADEIAKLVQQAA
jgi:hypothetical protein